jgi:hypothetical protein
VKKLQIVVVVAAFILSVGSAAALATPLGINITKADGFLVNGYVGVGQGGEDNETEGTPNTIQSQDWDLEGIFLNGNLLSMVGGFKFDTGVLHSGTWYTSGDIFFDVGKNGTFDYAIRMFFNINNQLGNNNYQVYRLTGTPMFIQPTDVPLSTPYKFNSGYTAISPMLSLTFGPIANTGFGDWTAADPGDKNWQAPAFPNNPRHYVVQDMDIGFIQGGQTFTTHFTMLCGNDLLVGEATSVAEPASILLLGVGLGGLALRLKRRKD